MEESRCLQTNERGLRTKLPGWHLDLGLLASRIMRNKLLCKPPGQWYFGASDVEKQLLAATEATLVSSDGHGNGAMALKTLQRPSVALRVKPQPLSCDFKALQDL